jgi:monoamine oxidase
MTRTPLAHHLQQIAAGHATRRQFLGAAGAATAAAAAWTPSRSFAQTPARVVVVGGGLAGLTCAYRLRQAGVAATLYEASERWGGRCWTLRGKFADGQVIERGGELIDTGHLEIRQLCQELRLSLDNLFQSVPNGTEVLQYFDGRPYTIQEAEADFNAVYQKLHRDTSEASYPTTYRISTERGRQLDAMTLYDWIEESVPGGHRSRFGKLLDVAYNIEYGAETTQQSALNLIYLLGYSGQGQLRLFGPSNEKYHVHGGNDQITGGMLATLDTAQLKLRHELTSIARNRDGSYALGFRRPGGTTTVTADRVVLALPFSMLRSVNYGKAGFGEVKRRAITELPMGTNSKLNVGFTSRHWYTLHNNGDTYADTGYQATWEASRGQAGTAGILVDYTGGTIGSSFGTGTAEDHARRFLAQIEPVLPGLTAKWARTQHTDYWPGHPWTRGSYSYYKPGQYTRFGGAESEPEGAVHFAGEHTTQDYQGYLNGAVFTGQRAASEVIDALGRR